MQHTSSAFDELHNICGVLLVKVIIPRCCISVDHAKPAASQLIMEPDLRLQEIATAYGFHDEFHMSKAFKQKYGVSPQQYRKAAQLPSQKP